MKAVKRFTLLLPICGAVLAGCGSGTGNEITTRSYNVTTLRGTPGTQVIGVTAINDQGKVVGTLLNGQPTFSGPQLPQIAVVWNGPDPTVLPPLPGDDSAFTWGINNSGVVVGGSYQSITNAAVSRAVVWRNGVPSELSPLPGAGYSFAYAINSSGVIVGGSGLKPVVWQNGTVTDLGVPSGFTNAEAKDINDQGWILINAHRSDGTSQAFFWKSGQLTAITSSTGGDTMGHRLSNTGVIAGVEHSGSVFTAFSWQNGNMTRLAGITPGASEALAVDHDSTVVGHGLTVPVLWSHGLPIDLRGAIGDTTSQDDLLVTGLNGMGQLIVQDQQGNRGLLLTPR
jgi:uncharacterized membrane protein